MSQYGIKEVLNLSIVDYGTQNPILYSDYATVTTNALTMQRLDLRGGQGAYKIMSFDYQRDSTMTIEMPLVDPKMLAILGGDPAVIGAQNVFKREVLKVSGGTATLSASPVNGTLTVFNLVGLRENGTQLTVGTPASTPNTYSISGTTVTVNSTSNPDGSSIVCWYQYAAPTTTTKISISANKFPQAVTIFGDGLWRDNLDETDKVVKVKAYKARPKGNFTFTMDSTKATTLQMEFDLFGVTDPTSGRIQYIDYILLT